MSKRGKAQRGGEAADRPSGAQDINTLVCKPAPRFTLSDSAGKRYTVTPGQGHPVVLVFPMGIT